MNDKTLAIIVAGGRGSRIDDDPSAGKSPDNLPKQYRMLGQTCVLERCVKVFTAHPNVDNVLVVIHSDDRASYDELISAHEKLLAPVIGGSSRQQSVHNGLLAGKKLGFTGKVLIHDGARPFVTHQTICDVLENIGPDICSVPAHLVADTLKKTNDQNDIVSTVARHNIYCAQTPQGFVAGEILELHDKAAPENANGGSANEFTDDASMFEAVGLAAKIVPSPSSNFKITTHDDLARGRMMVDGIKRKVQPLHADIRSATGYDVHALVPGDGVILCGLKIPFDKKLDGHSDADVALHALTDALLGTIGEGDIGFHFPPSDPQWKGASSDRFLKAAIAMVGDKGGKINNVDVTIICEAPKIGPHREAMRQKLSQLCNLEIARVSVKATTNEKLGFIGRGEGIAAIATTTLSFGTRT